MATDVLPDQSTSFGERVRRRLTEEEVVWLTTVGHDGTPQPNPVWFRWDAAGTLLIFNRADARRLVNIRRTPRVSLNFDSGGGADIVVMTGDAEVLDGPAPAEEQAAYLEKYREGIDRISGSVGRFTADYPVPVLLRLTRVRGF